MLTQRSMWALLGTGVTALVVLLMAGQPAPLAPAHAAHWAPDTGASPRPNIVFIITDDQDVETLRHMPRLDALLADQGVTLANMFVTDPQCCPSHVAILTGQYPNNNGVLDNQPPRGGFKRFYVLGGENSTIAT